MTTYSECIEPAGLVTYIPHSLCEIGQIGEMRPMDVAGEAYGDEHSEDLSVKT